jgi:hypothetical protein
MRTLASRFGELEILKAVGVELPVRRSVLRHDAPQQGGPSSHGNVLERWVRDVFPELLQEVGAFGGMSSIGLPQREQQH